ncbi:MAG: FKBP-type peptidyl-prolyl cis-trans isomerase [Pseudomonadota bacterium]|nr:FKBP-type peptidyl-prolyl cis-trans isomerase [Pseudomonadota bacterium]
MTLKLSFRSLLAALLLFTFGCQVQEEAAQTLDQSSDLDSASYLIGYQQMRSVIEQAGTHVNPDAFLLGTTDAIAGAESQVASDKQELVLAALRDAITASNSEPGNVYRAENAKRPEVTTLPSGLQYEVIVAGDGPKPGPTDTVSTHYHGSLVDGTVFDSSVDRGIPGQFPVNGVIAGWTEALQLMGVGSKWRLVIPPELAYGERGAGGAIPPQATLIFEVELLDIVD